jgi:hypothetical protein
MRVSVSNLFPKVDGKGAGKCYCRIWRTRSDSRSYDMVQRKRTRIWPPYESLEANFETNLQQVEPSAA